MHQSIKILHLISSAGFLGAENVVLELSKETIKTGYWVTIGIIETRNNLHVELADRARNEGLQVQIFPCKGRFDFNTIANIRDFINEERPNILHSHGYKSNFYAWRAVSKRNLCWIASNHGKRVGMMLSVYNMLNILFMKQADKVITVSEKIADEMRRSGIPQEKIIVIDNGVDFKKFANNKKSNELRKSFGFNGNHRVIGTVASLTKEKGHIYLIEAARKVVDAFPDCCFMIVGDGDQRKLLEERTAQLGLTEKVLFVGSRKDIPEILSILDLFVLPSLKEGLPIALLEAMAARLPIIATKVGAISKVIVNNETGILVDSGSADSLRTAMLDLLHDRQKAKKLASRGFRKVETEYSSQIMGSQYLKLYRTIFSL
jgi:glycosyltransferase involved in cell wall biosynthesis